MTKFESLGGGLDKLREGECYARLLPKIYMHHTVELNTQPTAM